LHDAIWFKDIHAVATFNCSALFQTTRFSRFGNCLRGDNDLSPACKTLFKRAIRLNLIPPVWYFHGLGSAYFLTNHYDQAITALQRVLNRNSNFWPAHIYLAAAYSELKEEEKARAEVAEVLRIVPNISLANSKKKLPYKNPAVFERLSHALAKAGLK